MNAVIFKLILWIISMLYSNMSLKKFFSKRFTTLVARDLLPVTFFHMAVVIKKRDFYHLLKAFKIKLIHLSRRRCSVVT